MPDISSVLSSFTKGVRTAYPFIRGAAAAGIGPTRTYKMLQEVGMGGRKKDVLKLHKLIRKSYEDVRLYLPDDASLKPNAELIPLSVTPQLRAFHTDVTMTMYDSRTDTYFEQTLTVADNVLRPVDELMGLGEEMMDSYDFEGEVLVKATVIERITYSDNPRLR